MLGNTLLKSIDGRYYAHKLSLEQGKIVLKSSGEGVSRFLEHQLDEVSVSTVDSPNDGRRLRLD